MRSAAEWRFDIERAAGVRVFGRYEAAREERSRLQPGRRIMGIPWAGTARSRVFHQEVERWDKDTMGGSRKLPISYELVL